MKTTVSATTTTTQKNHIGATILALRGMINQSWGNPPSPRQIGCRISLEKKKIILPIATRINGQKALSEQAYRKFNVMAQQGDAGAQAVINLAKELRNRNIDITDYKLGKPPRQDKTLV